MMGCDPALIEAQPKLSFAASIRGITRGTVPLQFPYGFMEEMPRMSLRDSEVLKDAMRRKYAVHYTELDGVAEAALRNRDVAQQPPTKAGAEIKPPKSNPGVPGENPDTPNTDPTPGW